MPAVSMKGKKCTGHGCFPPRPSVGASSDVYVNGIEVHRETDAWAVHCCKSCHGGSLSKGSSTVFVNGLGISRIGDPVSCGSAIAEGSNNGYAGGCP
jgi:uncharacterized Zn-binding protein involved in type VI secretion